MEYSVYRKHTDTLVHSSFIGTVTITYARLVELFGDPLSGDGEITDAEWNILLDNGHPIAIYNYKDGRTYNGSDGTPVEEITDWRISGHYEQDFPIVEELLDGPKSYVFEARLVGRTVEQITKRLKTMITHIELDGKMHSESSSDYHSWKITRQSVKPGKTEVES